MIIAKLEDDKIRLRCRYQDRDLAKSIPNYKWNPELKCWDFPVQREVLAELEQYPGILIDTKVKIAVKERASKQKEVEELSTAITSLTKEFIVPIKPMPIKLKPYQHQITGFNLGIALPNVGLLYEQGCGKTLSAIAILGRRFLDGEIRRALIIAPTSVLSVWMAELENCADFDYDAIILQGSVEKKKKILEAWEPSTTKLQITIVNYEAVWRMVPRETSTGQTRWRETKSVFYNIWKPDIIISDESQRIKNITALQSKGIHKLARLDSVKYHMILTGTPITNSPLDIFSQFKFLDPTIFGTNFYPFRNRYAIMGGYGGYQIIKYQNIPELIDKIKNVTYRVTKAEALDLPETIDQTQYCYLEPKAARIYNTMKEDSILELEKGEITASNILAKLLRLSQITGGYIALEAGARADCVSEAKFKLLFELLTDLLEVGKKIIIFVRFRPEIKAIRKELEARDIKYSLIDGSVKIPDRGNVVETFQKDPECKIFIAQIQTGGLGITLTAADTAIFYSLSYSYADYDQDKARNHRIGQTKKVTYIHLIAKDTVDEKVLRALKKKKNIADEIIDNWRDFF